MLQLTSLKRLRLSGNLGIAPLPGGISRLSLLTSLELKSVGLNGLPRNFSKLNGLRHLDLAYNNLTRFPAALLALTALTNLKLNSNDGISSIPEVRAWLLCSCRLNDAACSYAGGYCNGV